MNWCRISINSGGYRLSEPPKLIIWNLNLETLASFKTMFNQQFEIPGRCMSCIITWLILCRSMICMWQCVHIYVCSHDLYWLAYCICICVVPLCLSATMFAGLQELEEDMIWPFTLRHAANAGVLNRPNNTINKCGFEIKRPFSAGLSSVFTVVQSNIQQGFNMWSLLRYNAKRVREGLKQKISKNASASKRYCCTSHLRPLFGKTPNDGRTLTSMPNNITCHFKLLIS